MGYTVKQGARIQGHYETKNEAYKAIKNELCQGKMPTLIRLSPIDTELFSGSSGLIAIIPDPKTP